MHKTTFEPSNYKFHSIKNMYKGLPKADINLEIYEYGTDAVEIKLINSNYQEERSVLKAHIVYFCSSFTAYVMTMLFKNNFHLLNIDIFFILWFFMLIWRIGNLVEFENLILCHDFGIHMYIKKFWGNHNRFVAVSNMYDIVINEVLEDLDCRYLLILRTKGKLFNTRPIICLFKMFKPSYECLSLIYKHIHKVIVKSDYR